GRRRDADRWTGARSDQRAPARGSRRLGNSGDAGKDHEGEAVKLTVNRKTVSVKAHPLARLLDVLREECGLTGTKEGCGEGECGACTVLVNGALVNSCLVPVLQASGADILTIEG